jgi:transcriptional regulator with XRE-family HTH domain
MPSKVASKPRTPRPKQKPSAPSSVRSTLAVNSADPGSFGAVASGFSSSIEAVALAPAPAPDNATPPALTAVDLYEPARIARTHGQELLLAVPDTMQQIATAIGVTKAAATSWRSGTRIPEASHRRRLCARYAIPAESWDRATVGAPPLPPPPPTPPSSSEPAAAAWFPDAGDAASPLDDCNRLLALLRSQLNRTDLIGRERVQLGDAFSRALAQKERLERARETLEARTIREHPEWRRMKQLIIKALLPHPEAAQAVEAAILSVLGAESAER